MSRRYTCAPKGDGPDAPHDRPAKALTKYAADFIAVCAMLGSPTGGMFAAMAVILVQVVLNMPDVFAGLDWAGLVALGGITRTPEQLSFLPPPPFNPQWPTKNTLPDRALKMLMDGRMICGGHGSLDSHRGGIS